MLWHKTEFSDIPEFFYFCQKFVIFVTFNICYFRFNHCFFLSIIVLKTDFEYGHWFMYSRLLIFDRDFELADTYHN